jgi:integrase
MRLAERKQLIAHNPFVQVDFLKQRNPRPPHIVTFEEEDKLLSVAVPYIRLLVVLILETGNAVSQGSSVSALDAVDFTNDSVRVRESKTRAGIRNIPLSARCKAELIRWREMVGTEFSPFVFPNLRNPSQPMKDIRHAWSKNTH